MQELHQLPLPTVLLLILSAGAFGGIAEFFRQIEYISGTLRFLGTDVRLSSIAFSAMLLMSALIGAAGAVGVHFVFILLKSFSPNDTMENSLLIISISVAAGFGARRILPGLAVRIQQQIDQVKANDARLEEEIQSTATELDERLSMAEQEVTTRTIAYAELFTKLLNATMENAPQQERQWAKNTLAELVKDNTHASFVQYPLSTDIPSG